MDNESGEWGLGPRPEEDLEYDLAHDAAAGMPTSDPAGGSADSGDGPDASDLTYVATETPDYAGDYSYDLSHDVPGR